MMWRFSPSMRAVVARARSSARAQGSGTVSEAHLFLAVLDLSNEPHSAISVLLAVSGVSADEARLYAQNALEPAASKPIPIPILSLGAREALRLAVIESSRDSNLTVEPRHLFLACLSPRRKSHLGEVLRPLGLDAVRLRAVLRRLQRGEGPYRAGNPLNRLTPDGERVIEAARLAARASFCGEISAAHLLLGLFSDEKILEILSAAGCDSESLRQRARDSIQSDGKAVTAQKKFAPDARHVIERAAREARRHHFQLDSRDLLLAFLPQTRQKSARQTGRNLTAIASFWTPSQARDLRSNSQLAPENSGGNEGLLRPEVFTNWKLMRFLRVVNVASSAILGLVIFVFTHWFATGTYSRSQRDSAFETFFEYLLIFGSIAAFSEGFFSGEAHSLRNVVGIALGVAIGYCWSLIF